MIRFFRSPQPAALIVVPFIVLVLWGQRFFDLPYAPASDGGPLWALLVRVLGVLPGFVRFLLAAGTVSLSAIYFNLMVNRHEVLYKNSYLPSLFYALLASASVELLAFHPVHLVNLVLLRVLDKTFDLYKHDRPVRGLFDGGFLSGLIGLFYPPAGWLVILVLLGILLLRPFSFRELLIHIVGLFLPYFFFSVLAYWNGGLVAAWSALLEPFRTPRWLPGIRPEEAHQVLGVIAGLLFLLALLKLRANYYKNTIRTRTYQQIVLLIIVSGAGSLFYTGPIGWQQTQLFLIPAALLLAYYFVSAKRRMWFFETMLWVLMGVVVWNHFGG
jgi:hypothetical protein